MIVGLVTTLAVGLLISVLGIINMTGNISSIHLYHRQRVRDEDKKAFGTLVGLGTLIVGIAVKLYGIVVFAIDATAYPTLLAISTVVLFVAIAIGIIISFYAMKKYNSGIF